MLKPIIAAQTDPGLRRDWNEDSVLAVEFPATNSALLMVADGMDDNISVVVCELVAVESRF